MKSMENLNKEQKKFLDTFKKNNFSLTKTCDILGISQKKANNLISILLKNEVLFKTERESLKENKEEEKFISRNDRDYSEFNRFYKNVWKEKYSIFNKVDLEEILMREIRNSGNKSINMKIALTGSEHDFNVRAVKIYCDMAEDYYKKVLSRLEENFENDTVYSYDFDLHKKFKENSSFDKVEFLRTLEQNDLSIGKTCSILGINQKQLFESLDDKEFKDKLDELKNRNKLKILEKSDKDSKDKLKLEKIKMKKKYEKFKKEFDLSEIFDHPLYDKNLLYERILEIISKPTEKYFHRIINHIYPLNTFDYAKNLFLEKDDIEKKINGFFLLTQLRNKEVNMKEEIDLLIKNVHLEEVNLARTNLDKINLENSSFINSNFFNASLQEANLTSANLSKSDFYGANLESANLSYANLSGSYLILTKARNANLSYANLSYADLRSTDFIDASLTGANLSYAALDGASLYNSNLEDVILMIEESDLNKTFHREKGGYDPDCIELFMKNLEFTKHKSYIKVRIKENEGTYSFEKIDSKEVENSKT